MKRKTLFMYPGQGSHYYLMAQKLYEHEVLFKKIMVQLDQQAIQMLGFSVIEALYCEENTSGTSFNNILLSHPAIFMIEYALSNLLLDKAVHPDLLFGASLGEFTALAISEVLSAEEALKAVILQAQLLETQSAPGGMMTILASEQLYIAEHELFDKVSLVAQNYQNHFVIAGTTKALNQLKTYCENESIICQMLPVSRAFHSSLIDPVKNDYLDAVKDLTFNKPKIPILSCSKANFIDTIDHNFLWDIVRNPIRFQEAATTHLDGKNILALDLGPSGVLANFIKQLIKEQKLNTVEALPIITAFNQDLKNLNDVINKIKFRTTEHIDNNLHTDNNRGVNQMTAYLFPGQGSQKIGMGKDLFKSFPSIISQADEILGYSIEELCINNPDQKLQDTAFTQPALYTVNVLTYLNKIKETSNKCAYLTGHSLGEYTALFAARVFDFATGLRLVKKRGLLMSQATGGAMAAVIGLDNQQVSAILQDSGLDSIDIANLNAPDQVVISGLKGDVLNAQEIFEQNGCSMYIPLKVSGAFHSRYMQQAKIEYESFLANFEFEQPAIPVFSNVTARLYTADNVRKLLAEQITSPVKWTETIQVLMGQGVTRFIECGPGNILNNLQKKIEQNCKPLHIDLKSCNSPLNDISGLPVSNNNKISNNKTDDTQSPVLAIGKSTNIKITMENLGSRMFKEQYGVDLAYYAGAMVRGIASKEMVVTLANAGLLGSFGTGGLSLQAIADAIRYIQDNIKPNCSYILNILNNIENTQAEFDLVKLYLQHGVTIIEAAAYMQVSEPLILFRIKGLIENSEGTISIRNRIIAKVSRPEVAASFLSPAPDRLLQRLLNKGEITQEEAELASRVPMADDICIEADSGGHTDMGVAYALMPAMIRLRDDLMEKYQYPTKIRIGAAGGIGTPSSAAAAFIMGADFICTGSINQCTVESGQSDLVKEMLQSINVQDTAYAPAGDMFEIGAKVQVLRKGVFFPARANKLYELYTRHNSIEELDEKVKNQIENKYFKRSFDEIWSETQDFFNKTKPDEIEKADQNPKHKMALIFRWYFFHASSKAMLGDERYKVDFQVHCGPALGAFNQWIKGTTLESWKNRHVDRIAYKLMQETAEYLNLQVMNMINNR